MNFQTPVGCVYGLDNARLIWEATTQAKFVAVECFGATDYVWVAAKLLSIGVSLCASILLSYCVYKLV